MTKSLEYHKLFVTWNSARKSLELDGWGAKQYEELETMERKAAAAIEAFEKANRGEIVEALGFLEKKQAIRERLECMEIGDALALLDRLVI